jgi:hypothetical protein
MKKEAIMRNLHILKGKGFILGVCGLLLLCFAISTIPGCLEDESSYEARIEEARIALDNGDYERARSLLLQLKAEYGNDPLVLQYLSNACAGLVGIDTFRLLEVIDDLIGMEQEGRIDMVGLVLGGTEGVLESDEIDEMIELLENCTIAELENIAEPTDDQIVQLGLASLFKAALIIADIVIDDLGIDEITLTEDGLFNLYGPQNPPDFDDIDIAARLDSLSDDIVRIDTSIDAILTLANLTTVDQNDLSEAFDRFLSDIDPNIDEELEAGLVEVTQQELENYIINLSQ